MRTYKQATNDLLSSLEARGWTVKRGLKVPHATVERGSETVRLWFKPQSIHGASCQASVGNPEFARSRSLHAGDFRGPGFTTAQLLRLVGYYF